jgi:hypothetical protein
MIARRESYFREYMWGTDFPADSKVISDTRRNRIAGRTKVSCGAVSKMTLKYDGIDEKILILTEKYKLKAAGLGKLKLGRLGFPAEKSWRHEGE